jgi:hypothetical protein
MSFENNKFPKINAESTNKHCKWGESSHKQHSAFRMEYTVTQLVYFLFGQGHGYIAKNKLSKPNPKNEFFKAHRKKGMEYVRIYQI